MSEGVRSLLVRGVAAAKANEGEEAHYYLEWVTRHPEADLDQRGRAWLWLSQITDDLVERRNCLEEVLAIDPSNALARRGLSILNGRLDKEKIIDNHETIDPLKLSATVESANVQRFVCPKCGGKMGYDANKRRVLCSYCGTKMSEYQAITEGVLVKEQDFSAMLPTITAHRWHLPTKRMLNCESCGATITLPPSQVSVTCPFCASAHVAESDAGGELMQPESVLPFQFDADSATQHIHTWLDSHDDLGDKATVSRPQGMYLPYWTFDIVGEVKWHALVRGDRNGQSEWIPRNGNYLLLQNDSLVAASHSLPIKLLKDMNDFDTKALAPYENNLIADWPAEIYQIALADASLVARRRGLEVAKEHVRYKTLGGETVRDLALNSTGVVIETYKLVLLPVWIASYSYKEEEHKLVVNGQTGVVAGSVPRSGVRKFLAGLFGGG